MSAPTLARPSAGGCTTTPRHGRAVVLTGPGAAAELRARRRPGDLVIDLDTLAATLGDPSAPHVRHVALGAVLGAVKRAQALREPVTAYLLHPDATPEQTARYAAQGLAVVATNPGRLP